MESGDQNAAGREAAPPSEASRALRIFGVPVRFHFTFVILVIFLTVFGVTSGETAAASALYVIALFTCVLLHELGHVFVSKRYGIRTIEIVMYPIGGVARLERNPHPREELWIALAGPAVNVFIAGALFSWLYSSGRMLPTDQLMAPSLSNLLQRIAAGNLFLAAFNMIPAFPMDGGRVLRALIARFKGPEQATRIAARAGRALAIAMGLFGLVSGQFMLIFVALFVYLGASQEAAVVQGQMLTQGIAVRSAMITDFRTLPHGSTVRDAADLLLATSQQDFPVVLGEQVIGLLDRSALLRGMAVEGPDAYIAGIMQRDFARISPDLDLAQALPVLADAGSCALVMEDGRLLGLLTRENLSEFLILRKMGMEAAPAGK